MTSLEWLYSYKVNQKVFTINALLMCVPWIADSYFQKNWLVTSMVMHKQNMIMQFMHSHCRRVKKDMNFNNMQNLLYNCWFLQMLTICRMYASCPFFTTNSSTPHSYVRTHDDKLSLQSVAWVVICVPISMFGSCIK